MAEVVVVKRLGGRFSAAALKMDTILAETTSDRRKEKLRRIADGSEGYSYAGALQRIKQQTGFRSILGMEVLMWISHSERPLRIDELCHALAVCRESCSDFDAGNAPSVHAVLSSCQGLIIIDKSDGETSIVRFIHPTLQTYLSTHTMHFSHPHCRIAETCLVYLTSRAVKALPATLTTAPPETPFLEYASYFWASHAERDLATTSSVKSLAQALLATPFDRHVSAKLLLLLDNYRSEDLDFRYFPGGFTGLHCLAFLGATGLANVLGILGQFSDINSKDFAGATPLLWAAKRGHTDFVQLLLNHPEIICDLQDETEKTALSWCALRGYTAIVQLLLSCEGVDPNVPDETGQTPLVLAAGAGNVDVVGRLLERKGVDVNAVDRVSGRTALSVAAGRGHEEVVRALLAKEGVEVERKDRRGRTALMWAGFRGWEGIVRVFLERDRGGGKEMSEEMGALAELAELGGFGEVMRVLG